MSKQAKYIVVADPLSDFTVYDTPEAAEEAAREALGEWDWPQGVVKLVHLYSKTQPKPKITRTVYSD